MKGIKRASHFLKQYFVFSKTERKGIYALLFLIALSLAVPQVWVLAFPPHPLQVSITDLPENKREAMPVAAGAEVETNARLLFVFDPNTADSATLTSLGFQPRTTRSMLNYRGKGGRFRKPEDLYRIYHVDSNLISTLIPYVSIAEDEKQASWKHDPEEGVKHEPKKASAVVEINSADSVTLVGLFGIGPKTASRIIEFRERSGGFLSLAQLTDVFGITDELLFELKGKITVNPSLVRYLNINTITYEELRQHPYLRYKTASAIINYRKQHGAFVNAEDLKKIVILPDSVYQKIVPYVKIGD